MLEGALERLRRVDRGLGARRAPRRRAGARASDPRVRILRASHPLPDARSVAAGEAALTFGATLALISGGASSLVFAPVDASLDAVRAVIAALLASGADVRAINVVRRHASRVHGGAPRADGHAPRQRRHRRLAERHRLGPHRPRSHHARRRPRGPRDVRAGSREPRAPRIAGRAGERSTASRSSWSPPTSPPRSRSRSASKGSDARTRASDDGRRRPVRRALRGDSATTSSRLATRSSGRPSHRFRSARSRFPAPGAVAVTSQRSSPGVSPPTSRSSPPPVTAWTARAERPERSSAAGSFGDRGRARRRRCLLRHGPAPSRLRHLASAGAQRDQPRRRSRARPRIVLTARTGVPGARVGDESCLRAPPSPRRPFRDDLRAHEIGERAVVHLPLHRLAHLWIGHSVIPRGHEARVPLSS